jgi:hypothetical protein
MILAMDLVKNLGTRERSYRPVPMIFPSSIHSFRAAVNQRTTGTPLGSCAGSLDTRFRSVAGCSGGGPTSGVDPHGTNRDFVARRAAEPSVAGPSPRRACTPEALEFPPLRRSPIRSRRARTRPARSHQARYGTRRRHGSCDVRRTSGTPSPRRRQPETRPRNRPGTPRCPGR